MHLRCGRWLKIERWGGVPCAYARLGVVAIEVVFSDALRIASAFAVARKSGGVFLGAASGVGAIVVDRAMRDDRRRDGKPRVNYARLRWDARRTSDERYGDEHAPKRSFRS
jgi:hypothetical protein